MRYIAEDVSWDVVGMVGSEGGVTRSAHLGARSLGFCNLHVLYVGHVSRARTARGGGDCAEERRAAM